MLEIKPPLIVRLQTSEGEAVLTFRFPRYNKLKKLQSGDGIDVAFEHLLDVEGLKDETGALITVEQAKELDIPVNFVWPIVLAFSEAAAKAMAPEAEPKNESVVSA